MRFNQAIVFLVVSWAALAAVADSAGDSHKCRCLASNASCWPTVGEWDALNMTVGGRLIDPKPTGRPCHDPDFDAARCKYLLENYFNAYLRADNAGSMQYENWEDGDGSNKTCSMNAPPRTPCHQGHVPSRGVQAEEISDVQASIIFAAHHHLRVAVKTSGHDFLGRSTAAESFLIWLHKLKKSVTVHESFATCDSSVTPAVTVAGGISWGEVYDVLNSTNYIVIGGMALTISATGGYVQGGGHGALSPSFGLAVDNVLEIEVVTADAQLRLVNECHDPELFFALRGGGGGTFGVVTSVTYKLHPTPPKLVGILLSIQAPNSSSLTPATEEEILTIWSSHAASLDTAKWGGYWISSPTSFSGFYLAPTSQSEANSTITTIVHALSQIPHVPTPQQFTFQVSTFQEWHSVIYSFFVPKTDTDLTGVRSVLGSRIIPLAAVTSNPRRVAQKLLAARGNGTLEVNSIIGPGVRNGDPRKQTAVTPAWRHGVWHVTSGNVWTWNATSVEKRRAREGMRQFVEMLQEEYPESGAYWNEASVDEPQWQQSFWGVGNYARLLVTKVRVDPEGMFVCRRCVGSEFWDDSGNCRRGL